MALRNLFYSILYLIFTFRFINSQNHFYPFGINQGDAKLPPNDDGSSPAIAISVYFSYFDNMQTSLFVNTNGLISFRTAVNQYTPDAFPLGGSKLFIAPFWADVHSGLNNFGGVYYRESMDSSILSRATEDIRAAFVDQTRFSATWVFIATWDRVTYYGGSQSTATNTFQAVLVTNGKHSFAIFNYGSIAWTSGTASGGTNGIGGTPAQAGFNAKDGSRFFSIPGSRTPNIINIASTTNVGLKGRWIFRIDNEEIIDEGCNTRGSLTVSPRIESMLGGAEILISGPCYESDKHQILCKFNGIDTPGIVINDMRAKCYSPITNRVGNKEIRMSINNGKDYAFKGYFQTISPEDAKPQIKRINPPLWENNAHFGSYSITWDKTLLNDSQVDLDLISYYGVKVAGKALLDFKVILIHKRAPNTGSLTFEPQINMDDFTNSEVGVLRVSGSNGNKKLSVMIWSDVHVTRWYTLHYIRAVGIKTAEDALNVKLSKRALSITSYDLKNNIYDVIEPNIKEFVLNLVVDINDKNALIQTILNQVNLVWNRELNTIHHKICKVWGEVETHDPYKETEDDLQPCPCNLQQARLDIGRFEADTACNSETGSQCPFNKGSFHCVKTILPSKLGAARQCCYNRMGTLLSEYKTHLGPGTLQRAHTRYQVKAERLSKRKSKIHLISHYAEDIIPYYYCCKWSNNCDDYYTHRKPSNCEGYIPPGPAIGIGDPHIITLDGFSYTFNGLGEFVIVNVHNQFEMQGRALRSKNSQGQLINATSWQALAMKANAEEIIQLELSERRGIDVLVNGTLLNFEDMDVYRMEGVTAKHLSDNNILVVLNNGVGLEVRAVEDVMNFQLNLPIFFKGKTKGLLGLWNDNPDDDLQTPNGTILPIDMSSVDLFYNFGIKWRTTSANSLFTYHTGQNHSKVQDLNFRPTFITSSPSAEAKEFCGNNTMCLYDFMVTGKKTVAQASKQFVETYQIAKKELQEVTCGILLNPNNSVQQNFSEEPLKVGQKYTFSCRKGYLLQGSKLRVCQSNGTWTGEETICYRPKCMKPHGVFANFEDCSTFYSCLFNVPTLHQCQSNLIFNDDKVMCDYKSNVKQPECLKNLKQT